MKQWTRGQHGRVLGQAFARDLLSSRYSQPKPLVREILITLLVPDNFIRYDIIRFVVQPVVFNS